MTWTELDSSGFLGRTLFDQGHDAIFILDLSGTYLVVNQRAADMLGYAPEELIGQHFHLVVVPDEYEDVQRVWEKLVADEHVPSFERTFRCKDGTLCPVEVNVELVRDTNGKPLYIQSIARDISVRRAAEQQMLLLELERQRSHILADFIVAASHEFRTPLSNINTSLHILRRVDEIEEREKRLGIIQEQVDRIAALVTKMLFMTRLDSGEIFHYSPIDLSDLVYEAEISLIRQIEARGILFERLAEENLPFCLGDTRYLHRAFVELLDNAIKFSPPGSRVLLKTRSAPNQVMVEIVDQGAGISETDLPRIFERFYRGDKSYQHYGFGLGLSIARHIVQQHDGRIEVESALDHGSTFRVILPTIQSLRI